MRATHHTPGRLKTVSNYATPEIHDLDGNFVAALKNGSNRAAHDARRLVACWNVCEGMSTESLEFMPGQFFKPPYEQLLQVEAQRDNLLDQASADLWNAERNLGMLSRDDATWHHWHGRRCGLYVLLQRAGRLPVGPFGHSAEELQRLLSAACPQLPDGFEDYPPAQAHQWLQEHGIETALNKVAGLQRHLLVGLSQYEDVELSAQVVTNGEALLVGTDGHNGSGPHAAILSEGGAA